MKSWIFFILMLLSKYLIADPVSISNILQPSLTKSTSFTSSAATFHQTSGDATTIQKVTLTYFTSTNCSTGPYLPAFSTPNSSDTFTIPPSGNVVLNASSVYNVAITSTPGTTTGLQSVLVSLGNLNGTTASFAGSTCASNNNNCCLPITCNTITQTCISTVATQNFTLSVTAPTTTISTSSPLLLQPGTTGSLLITNTGTSTASNITATLPSSLTGIVTTGASTCGGTLAANATCQISFTASSTLQNPTLITVQGSNTNTTFATIAVAQPYITNGSVTSMAQDTSRHLLYIGGSFTQVSPNTGYGVPVSTITAAPVATFPQVNGSLRAVVSDGTGGWYIAGTFTNVGGLTRNNLAHIQNDGSVDSTWNPNINATVTTLALSPDGSTIYAGGGFTTVNGSTTRNRIAAFNNTNGTATSWDPNLNGAVNTLALSPDGTIIYAGGSFTTVNGSTTRNRIAAFNNTTGTATSWDPNITAIVNTLALSPDGTIIYAGGAFTTVNGSTTRNRIAAFNNTDGTATSWNPNIDAIVNTLALSPDGTIIYTGGSFTTVNGSTPRNRIAALDNSSGTATSWDPNVNSLVYSLALSPDGTIIYTGGAFTTVNGSTTQIYIAAFDHTTGIATSWNPKPNNSVRAVALNNNVIYIAGDLTGIGGITRNNLAAIDTSNGQVTSWDPNLNTTVNTVALSPNGSTIYAGGAFTTVNGSTTRNRIAAFNNTTGTVTSWDPNINAIVNTLALSPDGTIIYAGGAFTTVNGSTTRNGIAAFNNTNGTATSWNPNLNGAVNTLALSPVGTIIYVGGSFTTVNGSTTRNCIAAFNNTNGTATSWNPNLNGAVNTLALSPDGTIIYAGGAFSTVNGSTTRNRIAAFNTSGIVTSWDPNINNNVISIALSPDGTIIYAGGAFTRVNTNITRNRLAAFDNASGTATSWDPNANNNIRALATNGTTVYAGGLFQTIGNLEYNSFAIITQ